MSEEKEGFVTLTIDEAIDEYVSSYRGSTRGLRQAFVDFWYARECLRRDDILETYVLECHEDYESESDWRARRNITDELLTNAEKAIVRMLKT
jgi:hypothetical protein